MLKIIDDVYSIPGQDEMMPDSHTYVLGNVSSKDLSLLLIRDWPGRGNIKWNR